MPLLNQEIVRSIAVRLPPIEEQRRIAEIIEASAAEIEAVRLLEERGSALKDCVLSSLLSRSHAIPDSYDSLVGEHAETPPGEPALV